jgi:ABC-type branched-subunit amino acid transport system substrate-binding protein
MKPLLGTLAGATAALLTLVACGSDGGSTAGPQDNEDGAGGGTAKVMVIGQFQATAFSFPEMADAVKAAIEPVNADGGINGTKIEVLTCNDQGDPNVAGKCAREAVSERVVAVIGSLTLFGGNITPLLEAAKIPYIGQIPLVPADYNSPISYPVESGNPGSFGGVGTALVQSGCENVGVLFNTGAASEGSGKLLEEGVKAAGGTVTKSVGAPDTTADYSAPVSVLLESGAECIGVASPPASMAKIIGAIRQSSKPTTMIGAAAATLPKPIITALKGAAEGVLVVQSSYKVGEQTPTFVSEMTAAFPDAAQSSPAASAWTAAKTFVAVASEVDGEITAASVIEQLNETSDLELELLPEPINFTEPNSSADYPRLFNTKALVYKVTGNELVLDESIGTIDVQDLIS